MMVLDMMAGKIVDFDESTRNPLICFVYIIYQCAPKGSEDLFEVIFD